MSLWRFIKRPWLLSCLLLISFCLSPALIEASYHVSTAHMAGNWLLSESQQTRTPALSQPRECLEVSSPWVDPWDGRSFSQHLGSRLWETLSSLTHRNYEIMNICFFKLLNFGSNVLHSNTIKWSFLKRDRGSPTERGCPGMAILRTVTFKVRIEGWIWPAIPKSGRTAFEAKGTAHAKALGLERAWVILRVVVTECECSASPLTHCWGNWGRESFCHQSKVTQPERR